MFRGVTIDDNTPTEEMYEIQFNDIIERDSALEEPMHEQIPTIFTSVSDWLKSTNVKCWYCDLNFSDIPIFIPKSIEPYSRSYKSMNAKYIMSTEGCFCSFHCAMAYINVMYTNIHEYIRRKNLLLLLFKEIYGFSIREIKSSPDKYKMIQYGIDTVTPCEYRKMIESLKNECGVSDEVRNQLREDAFLNLQRLN